MSLELKRQVRAKTIVGPLKDSQLMTECDTAVSTGFLLGQMIRGVTTGQGFEQVSKQHGRPQVQAVPPLCTWFLTGILSWCFLVQIAN